MNRVVKSLADDGVPSNVIDRFEKGREAAAKEDYLTAHGQFLLAAREGGSDQGTFYKEIVFFGDLTGVWSGQYEKWGARYQAMKEAFSVAADNTFWLAMLYATVEEDADGLRLLPKKMDQQLWQDADKHSDTSYGIVWIANKGMQVAMSGQRQQFQALSGQVFAQLLRNLQVLQNGPKDGEELPSALEVVEQVADNLAEQATHRRQAAVLYDALARMPESSWNLQGGADESGRDYESHREHAIVRLELMKHSAKSGAKAGGCCLGALPIALLSLPFLAFRRGV